jgi:hypothetical protein
LAALVWQPGRGRREDGPAGAAPDAARRRLHGRHQVAEGPGDVRAVEIAHPPVEVAGELGARARPLVHEGGGRGKRVTDVAASQPLPPGGAGERPVQDRLHQRAQPQAIGRGDGVDRGAHQRRADDGTLLHRLRQVAGVEAVEPGPQGRVPNRGNLSLQSDEVPQRRGDIEVGQLQEQLALQRCSPERAPREDVASRMPGTPAS